MEKKKHSEASFILTYRPGLVHLYHDHALVHPQVLNRTISSVLFLGHELPPPRHCSPSRRVDWHYQYLRSKSRWILWDSGRTGGLVQCVCGHRRPGQQFLCNSRGPLFLVPDAYAPDQKCPRSGVDVCQRENMDGHVSLSISISLKLQGQIDKCVLK